VIQSINQKPVSSPEAAAKALKEAAKRGNILLLIERDGAGIFVGLSTKGSSAGSAG
jgi:hypothetical protein